VYTDYAIPIWLGDVSVGSLLYLKRLQVIPFFDWAQINTDHNKIYCMGTDLLVDFHTLRIGGPISAGVRALLKADGQWAFQALFSVSVQ
jgi:hypothetical protein